MKRLGLSLIILGVLGALPVVSDGTNWKIG